MEVIFLGNLIAAGEKNNFCIPVREDVSAGLKIHENWPNFPYHNLNTYTTGFNNAHMCITVQHNYFMKFLHDKVIDLINSDLWTTSHSM